MENDHLSGVIKSPYDPTDEIFERLSFGNKKSVPNVIPQAIDLRNHSLPSRNQGNRGTCAAFAGATIRESQESLCGIGSSESKYLSPEFIYYHRDNSPSHGMSGRNVFTILKNIGTVPEIDYPYGSDNEPSRLLYETASQHKITFFARITTMGGLKKAISQIGPCYLVLPLYKTRPQFWISSGDESVEGHAVVVIGYNQTGFIIKNSWGKDWNDGGCIVFPYTDWDIHWECWVCTDRKIRRCSESGSQSTSNIIRTEETLDNVKQKIQDTGREFKDHVNNGIGANYEEPTPRRRRRLINNTCTIF